MNAASLTAALKEESLRLGFDLTGATPAVASPDFDRLRQWVAEGCAADMPYFAQRLDAYRHPGELLDGAKGILMLGMNYRTVEPAEMPHAAEKGTVPICRNGPEAGTDAKRWSSHKWGLSPFPPDRRSRLARVSRYAWGQDYHEVIRPRLDKLADFHRRLVPTARVRAVVDTAPLLERRFGQLAGLGWIGKNTVLINRRFGSWFFLAALLTTEELDYDEPAADHCGSCRACLDACPSGALVEGKGGQAPFAGTARRVLRTNGACPPFPGTPSVCLDVRKCLSYLTIESRGPLPAEFHATSGSRLFGCDACQEACPWNRHTPATAEPAFQPAPGMNPVDLVELLSLDEAAFRLRFRHTPLWRAKREGILRNAAAVMDAELSRFGKEMLE